MILRTLRDAGTIRDLLERAERESTAVGEVEPGAEHVVLAAVEMDDRSAATALAACGATAADLRQAIEDVHTAALEGLGIVAGAPGAGSAGLPTGRGLYRAKASTRDLLTATRTASHAHDVGRLRAAHVLIGATTVEEGTLPRALAALGIAPDRLRAAAVAALRTPG